MRIRRVVDLSVPVEPETQVYPGDPQVRFARHATVARDGYNLLHLELGSQTGTHIDAPYHFKEDGPRIDELDLGLFTGPGVRIDVRGVGAREAITWEHIAPAAYGLAPGTIVLLCTGWSRHYGTPEYFDHPFLGVDACQRLLDLGVRTFCIDTGNIDETPDDEHPGDGYPVHHLIAGAGGVIGENLRNLELVEFPSPLVSCLPIALLGADGAPARAVAMEWE
ncbi:cyclase family protein [Actinoplanes sp. NPDC024001]|uniref:cyclase family protein n=1 Tax=Actinoplanes sp. NPDC024001 TaxID=3154598 RepID=UPI0033F34586